MNRILLGMLITFSILIISCAGGGGSSSSSPSSSSFQAGLSIGDNGTLCINSNTTATPVTTTCPAMASLSYQLTITDSSFGLQGQVLTGSITDNGDGSYHIVGTDYGNIFVYPTFSILTLKLDPLNPIYSKYYALNPNITKATYIPIFAVNSSSLLTTTDQVTSSGASLDFREVSMGMTVSGGVTSYLSEASHGTVTKTSNSSFTVNYCSNNGNSSNNSNLTTANCKGGLVNTSTFSYDTNSSSWLVTPIDPLHSSQVTHAYFVQDVMNNSVAGYIDTSDATQTSSKFAYVAIVPIGTLEPDPGTGTFSLTSYQLCSSNSNCASTNGSQGIYYANNIDGSAPSTGTTTTAVTSGWNAGCNVTNTDNYFAPGYTANYFTAGTGACTTATDRPDTIGFFFGYRVVNGKSVSLSALAGYDSTVTPSQKLTIGFFKEN